MSVVKCILVKSRRDNVRSSRFTTILFNTRIIHKRILYYYNTNNNNNNNNSKTSTNRIFKTISADACDGTSHIVFRVDSSTRTTDTSGYYYYTGRLRLFRTRVFRNHLVNSEGDRLFCNNFSIRRHH